MGVKRIQSAARVLTALEGIARHQPIGVSALARLLGDDKSAVQRAIMTLADRGWIRAAPGSPVKWELTAHIHAVAHMAWEQRSAPAHASRAQGAAQPTTGTAVTTLTRPIP